MSVVHELEATQKLAWIAWWAMAWRSTLCALAAGIAVGVLIGVVGSVLGISFQDSPLPSLLGMAAGAYISMRVFHRLVVKGFGKYRLVVVEK